MKDEVKRIRFRHYKSFDTDEYSELDLSKNVCLIIGRNNSGKSSVINVLETVYDKKLNNADSEILLAFNFNHEEAVGYARRYKRGYYDEQEQYASELGDALLWARLGSRKRQTYSGPGYDVTDLSFSCLEYEDQKLPETDSRNWANSLNMHKDYANNAVFRRVDAERDIIPEEEDVNSDVDVHGVGTTNLIRRFITDSSFDEKKVEEVLLDELNKIMEQDACFEKIQIQQIRQDEEVLWEVFLKEKGQPRFALSQSGNGLKTIILMLVNLFLIPALSDNKGKIFVFAFEELENNLHPALQRRVFEYLRAYAAERDVRIFLTTHSHVAINVFCGDEKASVYHVVKESGHSSLLPIRNYSGKTEILEDLDVKASDLLQSNGIIWVEGPSDRIYIKRWLEVFTQNQYQEGRDYQFLYYGGRLLSHYNAVGVRSEEEKDMQGLIDVLTTNRNAALVMDSDIRKKDDDINATKKRIKAELEAAHLMCWVTAGKEIENYLTTRTINAAYGSELKKEIGKYTLFKNHVSETIPGFEKNKVEAARKLAPYITKEEAPLDLKERIVELYEAIKKWNQ